MGDSARDELIRAPGSRSRRESRSASAQGRADPRRIPNRGAKARAPKRWQEALTTPGRITKPVTLG